MTDPSNVNRKAQLVECASIDPPGDDARWTEPNLSAAMPDGLSHNDLIIRMRKAHEALIRERQFRMLVGEMFGRLTNCTENSKERGIRRVLHRIQGFAGVDQSSLLLFSDDGDQLCITDNGTERASWLPQVVRNEEFSWYVGMMREGQAVCLSRVHDLPVEATAERERAAMAGVKSHLCLPLWAHGCALGGIALTCFDSERSWPADLIDQLRVIGQILSTLLTLNRMESKLRRSVGELAQTRDGLAAQTYRLREEIRVIDPSTELVGHSDSMRNVLEKVQQVSRTQSTVLILGETGTGKELVARAIHSQSTRNAKPMVKVNCAALPSTLVESELFGREKGAYTGALSKQMGRFELADNSTVFLDEIGDLPLELQGKLLRVLQEGEFERLGSPTTVRVNVRIIAATNRDLAQAVRERTFREDLYYRLNVFKIEMPPLRDHPEDIPLLIWTFVRQFGESMAKVIDSIPRPNMEALQGYPWPGNVRQLRNVIEQAMIVCSGPVLSPEVPKLESVFPAEGLTLAEMERKYIQDVLARVRWRVSGAGGAAEILGMKATTLESRMAKLGIHRRD